MNPNLKRLRRSMMFLNCQKPALIKDPYIYAPDSIMLALEDIPTDDLDSLSREFGERAPIYRRFYGSEY